MAILSFLLGAAWAQDAKQINEFKDAIERRNSAQVDQLAQTIAGANTKKAVDALVGGYDIVAQLLSRLWQEKLIAQREADQHPALFEEAQRLSKQAEEYNKKPLPVNPGAAKAHADAGAALAKKQNDVQSRLQKVEDARAKVVKVDTEIVEITKIKRLIANALAKIRDDAAVKEMINDLSKSSNVSARAAVAEAMGRISHDDVMPTLIERLGKEQDAMVLSVILDSLRAKAVWKTDVIQAIVPHLASQFWQVKMTAVQALGASRSQDAVEPLVGAMATADGRLRFEIHDALVAASGVDKGLTPDAWKTWFETNRDAIKAGTYKPRQDEAAAGGPAAGPVKTVTFYGIPVKSKSFVIIMDRSGSMAEPGGYDEDEERLLETGTGAGAVQVKEVKDPKQPNLKPDARMRKIDVAKYQVKKVLYKIENGVKFNLIFFNHTCAVYQPGSLVTMSDGARSAAISWIEQLEPAGQTDPWLALQKAMEFCAEPGFEGKPRKEGADTIYIMTDGTPFPPGKVLGTNEICDRIRDWNRLRKMVFNTVYVSAQTDPDYGNGTAFMRRLAEENGGISKIPKNGGGAGPKLPNPPPKKP